MIPTALGPSALWPVWLWNGDAHFKADYYYSLGKCWEPGCLFSLMFLLAFSCPCLTSLFSHNGKFSIPALKIYSSRMPSPKPKSLGLPRGDKSKKTYLLIYWLKYRLDSRSQWPENGALDYNVLPDLGNFCATAKASVRNPLCSGFLRSPLSTLSLWILYYFSDTLSHSGPHPSNRMSPGPCSDTSLSQIEKHLGSFSSDPDNCLKEFKYLTQSYDLTWHEICIILSSTLLPEEKEGVWPLRRMLVIYTGQMTLSPEGPRLSPQRPQLGFSGRDTWMSSP